MKLEKLKLTQEQMRSFEKASMDTNPLHTDPLYASRTNFGSPVAYGIGTFLLSIASWAKGKSFSISKAKLYFKKPVFINQEYDLKIDDNLNGRVILEIFKGTTLHSKYILEYCDSFSSKQDLNFSIKNANQSFEYEVKDEDLNELYGKLGFAHGQVPKNQIAFLLWTSFYVGMINPGKQALFSQLSFSIVGSKLKEINVSVEEMHPVFRGTTINASADGFSTDIIIKAINRPDNIEYLIDDLPIECFEFKYFYGKTVLIAGASRGFGSVLAKILAKNGANVVAIFRSNAEFMKNVQDEVEKNSGKLACHQVDLADESASTRLMTLFKEHNYKFDYIFNNAAPAIYPTHFMDQRPEEFIKEFLKFFNISLNTLRASIPSMTEGGCFVNISSEYVVNPVAEFSHYISAKSAFEGTLRSVAKELPHLNFVSYRFPKMLTDQTNIAFSQENPKSPIECAIKLFESVTKQHEKRITNFEAVDLF